MNMYYNIETIEQKEANHPDMNFFEAQLLMTLDIASSLEEWWEEMTGETDSEEELDPPLVMILLLLISGFWMGIKRSRSLSLAAISFFLFFSLFFW